jgi:hypothetical protein
MGIKINSLVQKAEEKLKNSSVANTVSTKLSEKIDNLFEKYYNNNIEENESNTDTAIEENQTEDSTVSEADKNITADDVLDNIKEFFSNNSISNLIGSLVDSEKVDISNIDTDNYISREDALSNSDSNDSFEDYAKSEGIDLDNVTNDELTEAYNKYTERIAEKNEFNELYDLFANNETLSATLNDKVSIDGSVINKLMQGSVTEIHDEVSETGAFKTEGEKGGIGYNKRFDTKVSAAIDQMKEVLNNSDVSDEIKAQATEIIEKYENQDTIAVGKRDSSVNINSDIDEQVKQQGTGDCYLLATLNSLEGTDTGKEIIKNAIQDNGDGSYTVNLSGVNMAYTFSNEELEAAEQEEAKKLDNDGSVVGSGSGLYSKGDDDAMLVEMAIEKFRQELYDGTIVPDSSWPSYVSTTASSSDIEAGKSALSSGGMNQVLYLLSGISTNQVSSAEDISTTLDTIQEDIEKNGAEYAIYAGVSASQAYTEDKNGDYYINDDKKYVKVSDSTPANAKRYSFNGVGKNTTYITLKGVDDDSSKDINISNNSTGNHAISITNITDDTVTIINPWDSDKEITVSREEFESYMYQIQYAKLS